MDQLPAPLQAFGEYRQFIAYMLTPSRRRTGKTDKLPCNVLTGQVCDAHDRTAWVDFYTAAQAARQWGSNFGVGFVFSKSDPFWFLDIDACLEGNGWSPLANELCASLHGCAIEVSSSGNGLHIFGTGDLPPRYSNRNAAAHLEFYTDLRFVALTGTNAIGSTAYAHPNIGAIVQRYFPPRDESNEQSIGWWSVEPRPEWSGPTDDDVLIERMVRSASAGSVFGDRARFVDLWDANDAVLGKVWPPDPSSFDAFNRSHADAALAQHLAFWTGNDAARMERLMRRSKLARDKWEDRADYLRRTIRVACGMQREWLHDAPPATSPFEAKVQHQPVAQGPVRVQERTLLQPQEQAEFFAGCIYIADEHKVLVPDGSLLDPSRFNALYGGRSFVMDEGNTRVVRKAFEAFTESQVYRFPRADSTCFRPLLPAGQIINENGRTLANRYVKLAIPRAQGDASKFWRHFELMIPDEHDRNLLIGYMASCVQFQGWKFQWAPLVQGTTGNGKNILMNCVKHAIGKRYCYSPRPASLSNEFNAWLDGHTFFCVDEIYVSEKRLDMLEILKPMITEADGHEVTKKGVDASTKDICGNFAFLTNHRDAMRKNRADRRIATFFCAQQQPEDLTRDGITEDYVRDFVDWLKGRHKYEGQAPGYHIVADLLWKYEIMPQFDARFHPRAPHTSSTPEAIREGLGYIEQEILEAIEQGMTGFRGGFISSNFLKKLIHGNGRYIAISKHPEILASLGYKPHPALTDGRVNNTVLPDAARVRIYVDMQRQDLLKLMTPADVANAYSQAQVSQ